LGNGKKMKKTIRIAAVVWTLLPAESAGERKYLPHFLTPFLVFHTEAGFSLAVELQTEPSCGGTSPAFLLVQRGHHTYMHTH